MDGATGFTELGRDNSEDDFHQLPLSNKSRLDHPEFPEASDSGVEVLESKLDLSPPAARGADFEEAALMEAGSDAARLRPESRQMRPPAHRKLLRGPLETGAADFIGFK